MNVFDVYPKYDLIIEHASGAVLTDAAGIEYLDLYGGHGVISVGHSHPEYVERITQQLSKIGFYSNSVVLAHQEKLAERIGELSGYYNHQLFLCNSGAEAIENALKLASFHARKSAIVAFHGSFHGRTAAAVNVTDHMKQRPAINRDNFPVIFVPLNDEKAVKEVLKTNEVAAILVEGIQGVGGLDQPSSDFLRFLRAICDEQEVFLIVDEIQSGYGRSGKFFAHQYSGIQADLVTVAKGMGNGFPVAGVLIDQKIKPQPGMLGTTFGGNQLACAAASAVLDIIEKEQLVEKAAGLGSWLKDQLSIHPKVKRVKGMGLMLGVEFDFPVRELRSQLLFEKHLFTGDSANPNVLRILPPLTITQEQLQQFVNALNEWVL